MARSRSNGRRRAQEQPGQTAGTWDERLIRGLLPWRRELMGLTIFVLAVLTLFSLLGLTRSALLLPWSNVLKQIAGWGALPLMASFAVFGLFQVLHRSGRRVRLTPAQIIGLELIMLTALPISHLLMGDGLTGALDGQGGGLVGWALSEPLIDLVGPFIAVPVYIILSTWGLALLFRISWNDVINWLNRTSVQFRIWANELEADVAQRQARLNEMKRARQARPAQVKRSLSPQPRSRSQQPSDEGLIIVEDSAEGISPVEVQRPRSLPSLDLLEESSAAAMTTEEIDRKKHIIENTLADFGLPAQVTEIRRGPAVTQFGVSPGYIDKKTSDGKWKQQKVRVGQIASLRKDLALALAVSRLRIEAPVPGRGIVGVEVPNADTSVVRLRAIIESEPFQNLRSPLAVALGRDVAGVPVCTDLGKLPHLLIAGTTGSGKSVSLTALITCLVLNNTPDQLKLVLIDPKKVELIRFNGIPHLLGKVEVEPERVIGVLRWLTKEMDRRYRLFAEERAKQLADYNRKIAGRAGHERLPYIAVFVDELADLMNMYPGDVESRLCRLAQMARATGIHLVVATQRPSTDVITGLIKANFPARASFAVASSTDSRVILDGVGAEHLMGKGDMLFLPPDANAPRRVQGCFVSDREIEAIVIHWQASEGSAERDKAPWDEIIAKDAFLSDTDEMLERAIALAKKREKISTSLIQRRLRVGYPRAARLMELLHEMGLVEDSKEGGRTRRTLVNEEDDPLADHLFEDE